MSNDVDGFTDEDLALIILLKSQVKELTKENERLTFDLQDTKSSLKNYKEMVGYNLQVIEKYREALKTVASGTECSACSCACHAVADKALTPH